MPYTRTILQRYSDNVARTAVITLTSGTIATGYPLANFTNGDPSLPGKLNETTATFLFDWGEAQRQDAVALIHANLSAALTHVKYQCNATDAWTTPTVDTEITIPPYKENKMPTNAYRQLGPIYAPNCDEETPVVLVAGVTGHSPSGFRYARLVIETANPVPIAIGEIVIVSQTRTIEWLANTQLYRDKRLMIDHSTDAGVTNIFDLGVDVREFEGRVTNRPAQRIELDRHWADARGRSLPFLFVPNAMTGEPWLSRWADPIKEEGYVVPNISALALKITELGRGLYPTPSAV